MFQSKFQTLAIQLQMESYTKVEAMTNFKTSCKICTTRGIRSSCEQCPIKGAHDLTVAVIQDLMDYDEAKELRLQNEHDEKVVAQQHQLSGKHLLKSDIIMQ
jgi:hypothetical protein